MTDVPAGTVTFLFSDIEGSTHPLQQLGAQYAEALGTHQALLRAAFADHHGREVDTQGDSFFAAFPTATDALAAAAQAQQALAAYPWQAGTALCVRIGLHTGAPVLAAERYVGLDVHRAARIAATGHGGQVLLSQATRDLAEGDLPDGTRLLDLGEHQLKDLQRPEHFYQLVLPDLPADFPPLKTLDRARHPTVFRCARGAVVCAVGTRARQLLGSAGPGTRARRRDRRAAAGGRLSLLLVHIRLFERGARVAGGPACPTAPRCGCGCRGWCRRCGGRGHTRARLFGAAAMRDLIGAPQPPNERVDQDAALQPARTALGEAAWQAALAAGHALSLQQAIEEALDVAPEGKDHAE